MVLFEPSTNCAEMLFMSSVQLVITMELELVVPTLDFNRADFPECMLSEAVAANDALDVKQNRDVAITAMNVLIVFFMVISHWMG